MKDKKPFYITTTLPYVNANPHIGFALEIIRADAIARFKRLTGHDVFFNTGTDEHGSKILEKAEELGKKPQEYVDEISENYRSLTKELNISEHNFIRTTDENHIKSAQEFWKKCKEAGYIEKKKYNGLYCVGCEMFVKENDLNDDGTCPDHPNKKPEMVEEENYFFKLSNFEKELSDYYEKNPTFIIPESRLNEMKAMVKGGLEDFSISRLKEKLLWGVPVPDDDEQVMYVWFDALVNYISTLGYPFDPTQGKPDEENNFKKFWIEGETVQVCGKDNTQHQALRWQAMLASVGIPFTNHVLVNGFINSGGKKMSKSLGNVIDPIDIIEEYGVDALRYYVLRELHPHEDSDFTIEKFREAYNANLANGVGNLTNRIMKLAEDHLDSPVDISEQKKFFPDFIEKFDKYDYSGAIGSLWLGIGMIDEIIQKEEPFKVIKEDVERGKEMIVKLVKHLAEVAYHLQPFLPETAEKMFKAIEDNKKPEEPLFKRLD